MIQDEVIDSVRRRQFLDADKVRPQVVNTLNDQEICENLGWLIESFGKLCGQLFDGAVVYSPRDAEFIFVDIRDALQNIDWRYQSLVKDETKPDPVTDRQLMQARQLCKHMEEFAEFIANPIADEACDVSVTTILVQHVFDVLVSEGRIRVKLAADEQRGAMHRNGNKA